MYSMRQGGRRSIRLKGYDYSRPGLYFITLSCKNKAHLFGRVEHSTSEHGSTEKVMVLNQAGLIAQQCWLDIPKHYPYVILHEFVIMPNHVHGIIEIIREDSTPYSIHAQSKSQGFRSPSRTVRSIVRGYKIGVTKWMRTNTDIHDVWLRDYYEIIIRDPRAYLLISRYIRNNPRNWGVSRKRKKNAYKSLESESTASGSTARNASAYVVPILLPKYRERASSSSK